MGTRTGILKFTGCIALCAVCGCTEPGETTGIGAAAGGVLGAGLGAIVGNQTGNPGAGLTIGAAAGAGTGAMIANALEAQQGTLRSQDEAIERQEQLIRAQKSELDELRRMNQNSDTSASSRPGKRYSMVATPAAKPAPMSAPARLSSSAEARKKAFEDSKPADNRASAGAAERGAYNWNKNENTPAKHTERKEITQASASSSECIQARAEAQRAKEVGDSAEKLFHLRRALRMCPDNPDYHNQLGELYFSLNRKDDAEYEYNEALRLSPSNREARANLEYVKSK